MVDEAVLEKAVADLACCRSTVAEPSHVGHHALWVTRFSGVRCFNVHRSVDTESRAAHRIDWMGNGHGVATPHH
jgi:hypothetical protein